MNISITRIILSACVLLGAAGLKAQSIVQIQQGKPSSIRGMSVVNAQTAWISGSRGYVAITHDGGNTWDWQQVKGFEKAEFRDIEAFSDKEAVIMSSGTPSLVLKTTDGGINWKTTYSNSDTTFFFDAMAFTDKKHGFILGDPIGGKFLMMETKDGGESWERFKYEPAALSGEAAFAASGTCLRADKTKLIISSGGTASRLLTFSFANNKAQTWAETRLPFPHQKASQGSFSSAANNKVSIVVGGDYANDKRTDSVACLISAEKGNRRITQPATGPQGFQSCVEHISGDIFLATGTSGSNITTDGGKTWRKIDDTSFNVCLMSSDGKLVLLAGDRGKTGILKL